jgi:hypothetical protein
MRTLALVALLSTAALATEPLPVDAPTAQVFPPGPLERGRSVTLLPGEPAPYAGRLLDDQEQVRRARLAARDAAELADLRKGNVTMSVPVAVAIVAGGVAVGFAVGFAVGRAAAK